MNDQNKGVSLTLTDEVITPDDSPSLETSSPLSSDGPPLPGSKKKDNSNIRVHSEQDGPVLYFRTPSSATVNSLPDSLAFIADFKDKIDLKSVSDTESITTGKMVITSDGMVLTNPKPVLSNASRSSSSQNSSSHSSSVHSDASSHTSRDLQRPLSASTQTSEIPKPNMYAQTPTTTSPPQGSHTRSKSAADPSSVKKSASNPLPQYDSEFVVEMPPAPTMTKTFSHHLPAPTSTAPTPATHSSSTFSSPVKTKPLPVAPLSPSPHPTVQDNVQNKDENTQNNAETTQNKTDITQNKEETIQNKEEAIHSATETPSTPSSLLISPHMHKYAPRLPSKTSSVKPLSSINPSPDSPSTQAPTLPLPSHMKPLNVTLSTERTRGKTNDSLVVENVVDSNRRTMTRAEMEAKCYEAITPVSAALLRHIQTLSLPEPHVLADLDLPEHSSPAHDSPSPPPQPSKVWRDSDKRDTSTSLAQSPPNSPPPHSPSATLSVSSAALRLATRLKSPTTCAPKPPKPTSQPTTFQPTLSRPITTPLTLAQPVSTNPTLNATNVPSPTTPAPTRHSNLDRNKNQVVRNTNKDTNKDKGFDLVMENVSHLLNLVSNLPRPPASASTDTVNPVPSTLPLNPPPPTRTANTLTKEEREERDGVTIDLNDYASDDDRDGDGDGDGEGDGEGSANAKSDHSSSFSVSPVHLKSHSLGPRRVDGGEGKDEDEDTDRLPHASPLPPPPAPPSQTPSQINTSARPSVASLASNFQSPSQTQDTHSRPPGKSVAALARSYNSQMNSQTNYNSQMKSQTSQTSRPSHSSHSSYSSYSSGTSNSGVTPTPNTVATTSQKSPTLHSPTLNSSSSKTPVMSAETFYPSSSLKKTNEQSTVRPSDSTTLASPSLPPSRSLFNNYPPNQSTQSTQPNPSRSYVPNQFLLQGSKSICVDPRGPSPLPTVGVTMGYATDDDLVSRTPHYRAKLDQLDLLNAKPSTFPLNPAPTATAPTAKLDKLEVPSPTNTSPPAPSPTIVGMSGKSIPPPPPPLHSSTSSMLHSAPRPRHINNPHQQPSSSNLVHSLAHRFQHMNLNIDLSAEPDLNSLTVSPTTYNSHNDSSYNRGITYTNTFVTLFPNRPPSELSMPLDYDSDGVSPAMSPRANNLNLPPLPSPLFPSPPASPATPAQSVCPVAPLPPSANNNITNFDAHTAPTPSDLDSPVRKVSPSQYQHMNTSLPPTPVVNQRELNAYTTHTKNSQPQPVQSKSSHSSLAHNFTPMTSAPGTMSAQSKPEVKVDDDPLAISLAILSPVKQLDVMFLTSPNKHETLRRRAMTVLPPMMRESVCHGYSVPQETSEKSSGLIIEDVIEEDEETPSKDNAMTQQSFLSRLPATSTSVSQPRPSFLKRPSESHRKSSYLPAPPTTSAAAVFMNLDQAANINLYTDVQKDSASKLPGISSVRLSVSSLPSLPTGPVETYDFPYALHTDRMDIEAVEKWKTSYLVSRKVALQKWCEHVGVDSINGEYNRTANVFQLDRKDPSDSTTHSNATSNPRKLTSLPVKLDSHTSHPIDSTASGVGPGAGIHFNTAYKNNQPPLTYQQRQKQELEGSSADSLATSSETDAKSTRKAKNDAVTTSGKKSLIEHENSSSTTSQYAKWVESLTLDANFHTVKEHMLIARLATKRGIELVYGGLPMKVRPYVWSMLLDVEVQKRVHIDYYNICKIQLSLHNTNSYREIIKDVRRTMQYYPLYRTEYGLGMLCNILSCLSFKHSYIGYCQSNNIICGMLLLFFNEENAFWAMDAMLSFMPRDYYSGNMIDIKCDIQVLCVYLTKRLPHLAKHLEYHDIDLTGVCVSWLMCLYIDILPFETVLRVWDIFFLEKHTNILLSVALAVLHTLSAQILAQNNTSDILILLMNDPYHLVDCDALIKTTFSKTCYISKEKVDKWRGRLRPKIEEEFLRSIKFLTQ